MLAVAIAMQARLNDPAAQPALQAWADEHDQTLPRIELGYRRPSKAQDWPFVALVPTRDTRDLIEQEIESAQVNLALGVRLETVARGAALGLLAVDALVETVLTLLSEPPRYEAYQCVLMATQASRVDALNQHPQYELEVAITLKRVGG